MAVFEQSFASNHGDGSTDADMRRWEDYYKNGAGTGDFGWLHRLLVKCCSSVGWELQP